MAIQVILCVETSKRADTDSVYISEVINHWYVLSNKVKISKIYMNTKSRYRSKDVVKEIAEKKKVFTIGETYVVYCIDTDQYERDQHHATELIEISRYCEKNNYDLVWFCHDVEEVFLGQAASDDRKVHEAGAFKRKKMIAQISAEKLSCNGKRACVSNILNVLDKYLDRKQERSC